MGQLSTPVHRVLRGSAADGAADGDAAACAAFALLPVAELLPLLPCFRTPESLRGA